jgi:hypothetical protein
MVPLEMMESSIGLISMSIPDLGDTILNPSSPNLLELARRSVYAP